MYTYNIEDSSTSTYLVLGEYTICTLVIVAKENMIVAKEIYYDCSKRKQQFDSHCIAQGACSEPRVFYLRALSCSSVSTMTMFLAAATNWITDMIL